MPIASAVKTVGICQPRLGPGCSIHPNQASKALRGPTELPASAAHTQAFVNSSSLGLFQKSVSLEPEANKEPSWSANAARITSEVLVPSRPPLK